MSECEYWIVGNLHNPEPQDKAPEKRFDNINEAIGKAKWIAEFDRFAAIAVWNQADEVAMIFTAGMEFYPA